MGAPGRRDVTRRKTLKQVCRLNNSATVLAISLLSLSVLPISAVLPASASTVVTAVPALTPVSATQP